VRRDQAETSVLFELISERYERKSLAITANTLHISAHRGRRFRLNVDAISA
jgi:DNA replication protein DnaC